MTLDLGNLTRMGLTVDRVNRAETSGGGGWAGNKAPKEQRMQDQKGCGRRKWTKWFDWPNGLRLSSNCVCVWVLS